MHILAEPGAYATTMNWQHFVITNNNLHIMLQLNIKCQMTLTVLQFFKKFI